jgi:hypothetical protein
MRSFMTVVLRNYNSNDQRTIQAGQMAHMWERRNAKVWWGNLEKTDHLENRGIDRRIILKWTLKI